MKTMYIECTMGAAGDMLMGALYEIIPDKEKFIEKMNNLGIPGVTVEALDSEKCGIHGTHMSVKIKGHEEGEHHHDHEHHHHEHHHSDMHSLNHIISHLDLSDEVKENMKKVYGLIAEAESQAHKKPVDMIHFHEVGELDAVADIAGVCILMEEIGAEKIIVSPVCTGTGHVHCAHGILPVPAPATAWILKGVPSYGGDIEGELCTPTGIALLKTFAAEFGKAPVMETEAIGYGMGTKDFEAANCVRVFLGETDSGENEIVELSCNIDDMTAEEIGYAMEILLEEGVLDVYTTSVGMKKSRPGTMITCLVKPDDKKRMLRLMFKHTTTLGIREQSVTRHELERDESEIKTSYGDVKAKKSAGWGVENLKMEYEERARIARDKDISILEIGRTER